MIKVQQTIEHDPDNGKWGNCFSAVLASLLHLPIEDIPVFCKLGTWERDLNTWLRPYGLAFIQIRNMEEVCEVAGIQGWHHEVYGTTVRGGDVLHANVGVDGRPVFDPHPDSTGLVNVAGYGVFIALEPWRIAGALHDRPNLPIPPGA